MIPKFRAWHKGLKKMFEVASIDFENEEVLFTKMDEYGENKKWGHIEDVILMQSTGLKDKNGKEIFEGDIVRVSNVYNAEIVFHDGCFCVHDKEKGNYYEFTVLNLHDLEVIGDKFEHEHLLKGNGD